MGWWKYFLVNRLARRVEKTVRTLVEARLGSRKRKSSEASERAATQKESRWWRYFFGSRLQGKCQGADA
eukprot:5462540-Pyramimonas_sp.AAC.1